MTAPQPRSRRVRILRDEVSRKIAAGEVIDRPFSIVRELLDNAIDAGSTAIDVHLEAGGVSRVRVVDDGSGMEPEDLALAWQPHATSKIESEEDLLRVSSLGFRGEALSSVAVCSRMVVTSCTGDGEPAQRLEVHGGTLVGMEPSQGRRGTVVDVSELFFNYPARRKFLRGASAESGLCRTVFVDRAVAHPGIAFRFFTDGALKLSLPPAGPVERIAAAYAELVDPRLLAMARQEGEGFSVLVVAGSPDLRRRDRRLLQGFVNGRRVSEFALLQAEEYGFSGHVPGGWYPAAFAFITIDPGLVDFNIHPAKKEVRFRNLPDVHRGIVAAIRKLLEPALTARPGAETAAPARHLFDAAGQAVDAASADRHGRGLGLQAPRQAREPFRLPPAEERQAPPVVEVDGPRFLGQAFGVFLLFELPGRLLILDQHAAHERIIFERLSREAPLLQELLFPLAFDVSEEEERRLVAGAEALKAMGISLRRSGSRQVEVTALSDDFRALSTDRLVDLLRDADGEEWLRSLKASAACRLAIKEGERVDPATAAALCREALALPVGRCPHGRPIWHELAEEQLLRWVDRPVEK
jgi:DNA mismatch repair protein MutL